MFQEKYQNNINKKESYFRSFHESTRKESVEIVFNLLGIW